MSLLVAEIMSHPVVTIGPEENLLDVATDMSRHHLRHLPVAEGDELLGLLSHRDLLRYSTSQLDPSPLGADRDEANKRNTLVREVMTTPVEVVRPNDSVAHAVRKLLVGRFGCLPVVDRDGRLVGIVSEVDLLRLLIDHPTEGRRHGAASEGANEAATGT